jgi:malonyl-CoA/methylmalonyl-CoA synthetase
MSLTLTSLRKDLSPNLPDYKLPTQLRIVKELPKTAMGKVLKRSLTKELFPQHGHPDVQT